MMTTIITTTNADTDNRTMLDNRCVECFLKTYRHLFQKFDVSDEMQKEFLAGFNEIVQEKNTLLTPEVQHRLNIIFVKITGINDPFAAEKEQSNRIALDLYNSLKPAVINSNNPFDTAIRLAIAGNIMDYGASNSFDIGRTINHVLNAAFAINHSALLHQQIQSASKVLYLGDNAGEIVFDRLFIEILLHNNVTYAVKSGPALNDATMKDASEVGLMQVADVITNGFDAPSTLLHRCSSEFLDAFYSADVIISKGQGNLEGLIGLKDPRIFFLLMVKCNLVAEMLGVQKGDFVVFNSAVPYSVKN